MISDELLSRVCGVTGVPLVVLRGRSRVPFVVRARWVWLYCLRDLYPWMSLCELADEVGWDCHGTVIHGLRRCDDLYGMDDEFTRQVDLVLEGV